MRTMPFKQLKQEIKVSQPKKIYKVFYMDEYGGDSIELIGYIGPSDKGFKKLPEIEEEKTILLLTPEQWKEVAKQYISNHKETKEKILKMLN